MRVRGWTRGAVLVALIAAPAAHAAPQTYTVSGTVDPPTVACPGTVCPSLRDAVLEANANPGSTIQLGSATYSLSQAYLRVDQDVTITGNGPGATTIDQTGQGFRVVWIESSSATVHISGLTITGGNVSTTNPGISATGGGILSAGALTLTNVAVTGNAVTGSAGAAGGTGAGGAGGNATGPGITSTGGSLTLVSSTVSGNAGHGGAGGSSSAAHAGNGGSAGPAISGAGMMTLTDSTVSDNQMVGGAGGDATGASATAGQGGGASGAIISQLLTLTRTTIARNSATGGAGGQGTNGASGGYGGNAYGGGLSANLGFLAIASSVSDNTVTGGSGGDSSTATAGRGGNATGGGGYSGYASQEFVNSTISGNAAIAGASGSGASPPANPAEALGGGVESEGASGGLSGPGGATFANATVANNSAQPDGFGGNIAVLQDTQDTFQATVVAAGSADHGRNCYVDPTTGNPASLVDHGNNLDDTAPSQCGFSSDKNDQVGAAAALLPLAPYGGPTQTMALGPGSPALGNGGSCTDPTNSSQPLAADQRGAPRPAGMCDIGAFQLQPPAAAGVPEATGTPAVGQPLACSRGSWTGDLLTYADAWLRDGSAIAGANTAAYTVTADDTGHQLTCQVTASNGRGAVSQTSEPLSVPSTTGGGGTGGGPVISGAHESHAVWVEGTKLPQTSRARKHPVGTVFTFTLSEPATVRFAFLRSVTGRRVAGKCVRLTKRNRARQRCTRLVPAATLTVAGHAGSNSLVFQGRVSRARKLKLGRYTLRITASDAAGRTSAPQALTFKIVKR